jgi:hypothetical protein
MPATGRRGFTPKAGQVNRPTTGWIVVAVPDAKYDVEDDMIRSPRRAEACSSRRKVTVS